jgi:ribosome-associated toxin RatA of RatAB toxin-antitoxin module
MHRANEITINGDLHTIYKLGAEIEHWPDLLPHYRSVDVLWQGGTQMVARMRASRNGIPVSWVCMQERLPDVPLVTFRHIGGFTRGMDVAWEFEQRPNNTVTVRIIHDFQKGLPIAALDRFVSDRIVGEFFVHAIASKTLEMVRLLAEADRIAHANISTERQPV